MRCCGTNCAKGLLLRMEQGMTMLSRMDQEPMDVWVAGLESFFIACDRAMLLKQRAARFMPRAQGRATMVQKRTSHITIVLDERS